VWLAASAPVSSHALFEYALKSRLGLIADRFRHSGRGRRRLPQLIRRKAHADVCQQLNFSSNCRARVARDMLHSRASSGSD
jgi:hypothetical protein